MAPYEILGHFGDWLITDNEVIGWRPMRRRIYSFGAHVVKER